MRRNFLRGRLLLVAALASLTVLAAVPVAQAKKAKVTGGSSAVTLSDAVVSFMSSNGITASAISPATGDTPTFTLPIGRGRINTTNYSGFLVHRGGIRFTK